MSNANLCIVVVSYNRQLALNKLFKHLSPILSNNVSLFVSDDSDSKNLYLSKMADRSLNFFYNHNAPALGHDRNIEKALSFSKSNFTWLIGDSIIPDIDFLQSFYKTANIDHSGYILSSQNPRYNYYNSNQPIIDYNFLFKKFFWFCTQTGSMIYNTKLLKRVLKNNQIKKYYSTNFFQLAIFYEMNFLNCNVGVINKRCFTLSKYRYGSYWYSKIIDVFCKDFNKIVNVLPSKNLSLTEINQIVRSHDTFTGLFSSRICFYCIGKGYISKEVISENLEYVSSATDIEKLRYFLMYRPFFIVFALCVDIFWFFKKKAAKFEISLVSHTYLFKKNYNNNINNNNQN